MSGETEVVRAFFERYEVGANTFDPDIVVSQYAATFLSGDADGVTAVRNDAAFREAVPARKQFFDQIGFKRAAIEGLEEQWLDDHFVKVRTTWRMDFRNKEGKDVDAVFDQTYFLYVNGEAAEVVFSIAHEDEEETMKRLGLF